MAKIKVDTPAVFERLEKKYMLTAAQYTALREALGGMVHPDQYGKSTICSLYYDAPDYTLIRHSMDKPTYKEKLRLRSYGVPHGEDVVYMELKKKLDGVTFKRRMALPLREAQAYFAGSIVPAHAGQIFREIDWFAQRYSVQPKVVICYDRVALLGNEDESLRITFDTNIRWRENNLNLSCGEYGAPLLGPGMRLMEIKTMHALPCAWSALLSSLHIFPTSFSKYAAAYTARVQHTEAHCYAG